ncbi:MAG TPA: hypothetical protein VK466_02825 [Terriglobales bacterium]|nr:hypothetical protein [Terriglobales bacterium]
MRYVRSVAFFSCLMSLLLLAGLAGAQTADPNPNCSLIVPDNPLSAVGLATPYQLTATDPTAGDCHESDKAQSAFVQAAVIDPATGQISIYNPLVLDRGETPAATPVVPVIPPGAIVALWFGYNADTLTLQANDGVLAQANCVNGADGTAFGQYSYCNAPAFFRAAHRAIRSGLIKIPPLGTAADGRPCPTVRDFFVVDQDQSDNLPTSYLVTSTGMAQRTQLNLTQFPGATSLGNPSDNRLVDVALDGALGCTPWKAPDLADPGQMVPALPLNELQARALQASPVALVPAGDPMVLNNGAPDLAKVTAYRRGVDQPPVLYPFQADTARYCRNMVRIAPARLLLDQQFLMPDATHPTRGLSPDPTVADSLFTFMAQRFVASFDILGCGNLLHVPDPITITTNSEGVTTAATIDTSVLAKCQRSLAASAVQDQTVDSRAAAAAATE